MQRICRFLSTTTATTSNASLPVVACAKPFKQIFEANKQYSWCSCGLSKKQPFCDGSHKGTGFHPVRIELEKETEVWLCGCKHTKKPPYCDGTHKTLVEKKAEQ